MTVLYAAETIEAQTTERKDCPVCNGTDLLHSVTSEAIPVLCNALHSDRASALAADSGRFATAYCRNCSHVFNAAFDEDRIGYTQSYENSLHFSPRFVSFVEELADRLNDTYTLKGKTVIDIGCGKGDFLKRLCSVSGARGIGFDKSFEDNRGDEIDGVSFVNDWFGDSYPDLKPDFISCRHVVEHIAEPVAFLRELRSHPGVRPDTVFYFEVPNALYTLRDLGIWDLIYEHVSYFTPLSLSAACEVAGYDVLDAGTSFGGQYLYVEAKPAAAPRPLGLVGGAEIEDLMADFDKVYREKVAHWRSFLAARDPGRTVIWGGGSKGITFVNAVPGAERIRAIVDVNPFKQGRFAPGAGIPVVAPEALRGQQIQTIIVMNPLYRDEIAETARNLGLNADVHVA